MIARSKRDYNIRDKQHLVIGYLQLDGNVIDIKSNIIGKIDEQGNIKKYRSTSSKAVLYRGITRNNKKCTTENGDALYISIM